jgi:restriction system protein
MAVPDFQSFFKPLLDFAMDGKVHSLQEAREYLSVAFKLTEEDKQDLVPSGNQTRFDNRVAWAKSYFIKAKILSSPQRGFFEITERGQKLHSQGHDRIDKNILSQYPEFLEFSVPKRDQHQSESTDSVDDATPEEILMQSYLAIRNSVASDILDKVKENSPKFFEDLVVDLMVAMGYGGSRLDAGKSIGQSGDEGIDGIIKEDRLGLDVIYLQAKRWEGSVGRPEIQKFVGALHGKRAKKGVFITTSKFTENALEYVRTIDPKVILIDGKNLAEYMIDYNLGTSTTSTYKIKRIDTDYFIED